jgi:hypothetical protein
MLFSHPLLTVNTLELMKLWGELCEARLALNGYGGDTAEIYAYRFMAYDPTAHSEAIKGDMRELAIEDCNGLAANCLAALCEEFERAYEVTVEIDGESIKDWLMGRKELPYNWRAHVKVSG